MNTYHSMFSIFSTFLTFLLLVTQPPQVSANFIEESIETLQNQLEPLQQKYSELPSKGKFGVSFMGGFITTKISIKQTIKIAKYSGAAFIISEVMHHAGVLKDANFSEGTDKKLQIWKHKLIKEVDQCRMKVKKELTLEKVREGYKKCLEREKFGTIGFTTGTVAGLIL